MVTSEERMKILKMISEDKISAEEGAQLLSALSLRSEKPKHESRRNPVNQMLRVRVTDMVSGKTKVNKKAKKSKDKKSKKKKVKTK